MKDLIHKKILKNQDRMCEWFNKKSEGISFPVYSSIDVRDAGYKLASVDANIFPAGFNNICDVDQDYDRMVMRKYLEKHYKTAKLKLLLLTEEHTSNRFYWENVRTLHSILSDVAADVRVGVPKEFKGVFEAQAAGGAKVEVYSAAGLAGTGKLEDGFRPDLIISNNDFSQPYEDWFKAVDIPMNPSHELGWFRRKKSSHFKYYNALMAELCELLGIEPWHLTVATQTMTDIDLNDEASVEKLAHETQKMIDSIAVCQKKRGIDSEPVVFVKNNSGTYGMGIIVAHSADDILKMSNKEKKKISYAKGGAELREVILQEGVPTQITTSDDGGVAEPVIYLIGNELAGGFLRAHKEKGRNDNLNSPGSVFKKLCMSDLVVDVEGNPLENVYGTIARVNNLAIGLESRDVGAVYGMS